MKALSYQSTVRDIAEHYVVRKFFEGYEVREVMGRYEWFDGRISYEVYPDEPTLRFSLRLDGCGYSFCITPSDFMSCGILNFIGIQMNYAKEKLDTHTRNTF